MMPSSIMRLVLCTLTVCFFLGGHALPVVFPSFNTAGFAYITDTDTIVTIPAAFGHLLCSTPGESPSFEPAKNPCSRIILFTSNKSLTLNFLNLTSNGVVQHLTMTPQIRSSLDSLDLSWIIPSLSDEEDSSHTDESETPAPAERPSSNQFEEGIDGDNLDSDDEDSNEVQFRRLAQDASSVAGPPAVESVPPDVQEANQTSGFLDSGGAVNHTFNFVAKLYLEGLPEQELISLEFGFEDNITRSLLIYVDSRPVSVDIKQNKAAKENLKGGRVRYELDIIFSQRIVSRRNEEAFLCTEVKSPLNSLISAAQFSGGKHSLSPDNLRAVLNAADKLSTCPTPPKEIHEASCVSLSGVNATFISDETGLEVCGFTNRRIPSTTVLKAEFVLEKGKRKEVTVKINGDGLISLFGMPVPGSVETVNIPGGLGQSPAPSDPAETQYVQIHSGNNSDTLNADSVAAMKKLGTAISGLTGAAVGFSFVVSLGTPFLSFVVPPGGPDLMSELGCLSSVVNLMQIAQRTYLLTKLRVANLPESFKAFGEQFSWTMLNFRAPWVTISESDDTTGTSHSSTRRLLSNATSSEDSDSHEDPYSKLRDTYFWTGIALVSLGILHCLLLSIFIRYRNNVPSVLRLPRLELYLIQSCIAIVAQGPAYLFTGSTRQVVIGVLVLTVGIIPLAYWHYRVIRKYLFDEDRQQKKIVYTLNAVDMSEHVNGSVHTSAMTNDTTTQPLTGGVSLRRIPRENIQKEGDQSWFSKYIVSFLLGPLYRSGRWTWRDGQAVRVIDRYGPVFEDYRGKPMHETQAQQGNADEMDDEGRRFEPVRAEYRYPIDVLESSFFLRISEKVINLVTIVFTTLLILGEDDPESNYQAALLFAVQVAYVAYLRAFRPHCTRWNLGVAIFEKTLDAVSLFLVICKLNIGHSTSRDNIGVTMAILEATAIGMQLVDIVLTILPMIKKVKEAFWSAESEDRTPSLICLFMRHPNMEIGFEEMLFENPREAISVKIIQPLASSLRSTRRHRRHQSGTDSNHSRESTHNASSAHNQAEVEQTNE